MSCLLGPEACSHGRLSVPCSSDALAASVNLSPLLQITLPPLSEHTDFPSQPPVSCLSVNWQIDSSAKGTVKPGFTKNCQTWLDFASGKRETFKVNTASYP